LVRNLCLWKGPPKNALAKEQEKRKKSSRRVRRDLVATTILGGKEERGCTLLKFKKKTTPQRPGVKVMTIDSARKKRWAGGRGHLVTIKI